jgi:hypothetical protein
LSEKKFASPSIVIIGKVVGMQKDFGWVANSNIQEEYFTPVHKEPTYNKAARA